MKLGGNMEKTAKTLSTENLLTEVRESFKKIPEHGKKQIREIPLIDCLMAGLAVFALKMPSLLQYDAARKHPILRNNLKKLYLVETPPCDTYLRQQLDDVLPEEIRGAFKRIFALSQRTKVLEDYEYLDGNYLLAVDGTGQFGSEKIHCKNCCEKHHKDGRVSYYHQMLGAVIVHPNRKEVIPLAPEPITKQDGNNKNDCERNAAKRLLMDVRREHPHLKLIVVEDGLASNGPHIKLLKKLKMHFILGAKPDDHELLFDWVEHSKYQVVEFIGEKGVKKRYKFINNVPLNDTNFECEVNFLEYWETSAKGVTTHFSWVTDIELKPENVEKIVRGGRARWRIENETFNTLKNQGYNFEHNYGHGNNNLCSVLSMLMMLAFLIDQIQAIGCAAFKKARLFLKSNTVLWFNIQAVFTYFAVENWEEFFRKMVDSKIILNTS